MKISNLTFRLVVIITLLLATVTLVVPKTASALSGSEFNAARIIDDAVFYNKSSMTATQIQLFLNSKVPVCDTWGTKTHSSGTTRATHAANNGVSTPFTCLKDYNQQVPAITNSGSDLCTGSISAGTKSAAQIIYDSAQACGINPQTLIVLLQKEQSLITDDWPWPIQYRSATGYGCPDTAPCDAEFYGFFNQVYQAAKAYKRYRTNPANYNYRAGRNNTVLWHPNAACGTSTVWIENQATAGMYIYTPYRPNQAALNNLYGTGDSCSSYGNRNFWRMFNDWFGSTKAAALDCDSKVAHVVCVWSVIKSDGSQFLTSSKLERDTAINNYGWIYDGIALYASQTQRQETVPVYRLRQGGKHYYTAVQSERDSLLGTSGWVDEGIAFYAYPTTMSDSMSYQVYKLRNPSNNQHYWTQDSSQKQLLVNSGYSLEAASFYGFSSMADLPVVNTGRDNVYRLQSNSSYFYTTNLHELEAVMGMGYYYEGAMTTANETGSGVAVYRLRNANGYFYTSSAAERDKAVNSYGMTSEGVGFYLDNDSAQIYRLTNSTSSKYLYTSNVNEVMSIANTNGWLYEGMLFSKNINPSPVYRFLNLHNSRHFYTIDINEALRITNKGWRYETIAFRANTNSGLPVYRLRSNDKHFYTTDVNERNIAINTYGYLYEDVAFFVSSTTTSSPAYRLQGGNDEYFFTASAAEKDTAVSKYGYRYEGVGFYLP